MLQEFIGSEEEEEEEEEEEVAKVKEQQTIKTFLSSSCQRQILGESFNRYKSFFWSVKNYLLHLRPSTSKHNELWQKLCC